VHNRNLNALQYFEITVTHHENATPTYTVQWSCTLPTGVTISTSSWSTEDSNVTIANEANDNDTASARLSASSPGNYMVVNTIVDSDGNTDERWIHIIFKDARKTYDY